jgi:hypothetical protein
VLLLWANAWYAIKPLLGTKEEISLAAIVRMKKSKLKYRLTTCKNNNEVVQALKILET